MSGNNHGTATRQLLNFAAAVLAAAWALNLAAHWLVAVLPILAGVALAGTAAIVGFRLLQRRGSGG